MSVEVGSLGQFDVMLDGERIARRNHGLLTRLLGRGWPDPAAVIATIRKRQRACEAS